MSKINFIPSWLRRKPTQDDKQHRNISADNNSTLPGPACSWDEYRHSDKFTGTFNFYSECIDAAISKGMYWASELNDWLDAVSSGVDRDKAMEKVVNGDAKMLLFSIVAASSRNLVDREGKCYIEYVELTIPSKITGRLALVCRLKKGSRLNPTRQTDYISIAAPVRNRHGEYHIIRHYFSGSLSEALAKVKMIHPQLDILEIESSSKLYVSEDKFKRPELVKAKYHTLMGLDGHRYMYIGDKMSNALNTKAMILRRGEHLAIHPVEMMNLDTMGMEVITVTEEQYSLLADTARLNQINLAANLQSEGKDFCVVDSDGKERRKVKFTGDSVIDTESGTKLPLGEEWFIQEVESYVAKTYDEQQTIERLKSSGVELIERVYERKI